MGVMRINTPFSSLQDALSRGVHRTVATASRVARSVSTNAPQRRSRRTVEEAGSSSVPPSPRRSVRLGGWGCRKVTAYAASLVGAG